MTSFVVPIFTLGEDTQLAANWLLKLPNGKEHEVGFGLESHSLTWIEFVMGIPGTTFDESKAEFRYTGDLTVEQWVNNAVGVCFADDANFGLVSEKRDCDFFFPSKEAKQTFIAKRLRLKKRADPNSIIMLEQDEKL